MRVETCSICRGGYRACFRAEVQTGDACESTSWICVECVQLQGEHRETLVFEPVDFTKGTRPPTRAMKKKAVRRERALAESLGGRAQPNSGATPHAKGDVRVRGRWRIDDKTTRNKSFSLTRGIINKIRSECSGSEDFAITIGFLNPRTQKEEEEVVVMDKSTWEEMVNAREGG